MRKLRQREVTYNYIPQQLRNPRPWPTSMFCRVKFGNYSLHVKQAQKKKKKENCDC